MKRLLKSLSIISTVLLVSSCSKDSTNEDSIGQVENLTPKSTVNFDQFGISHNLAMDYVGNAPNFNQMTKHDIYRYIQGYSDHYFLYDDADTNWVAHKARVSLGIDLANDPANAAHLLLDRGIISSNQYGLIDSLFTIFDDAADYNAQTYLSIKDFNSRVKLLEDHILLNYNVVYNVQTDELNYAGGMLAACSIMKASYEYWRNAVTNSSHPWHTKRTTNFEDPNDNLQKSLFRGIWRGIKVGAVDTGVFIVSLFGDCNRGTGNGAGILGSGSCACGAAGEASSGV